MCKENLRDMNEVLEVIEILTIHFTVKKYIYLGKLYNLTVRLSSFIIHAFIIRKD